MADNECVVTFTEDELISLRTFMRCYIWSEVRDAENTDANAAYLANLLNVFTRLVAMYNG